MEQVTRQDDNRIVAPSGINRSNSVGSFPVSRADNIVNLEPNNSGQIQTRPGSWLAIERFGYPLTSQAAGCSCISVRLSTDISVVYFKIGRGLRYYIYTEFKQLFAFGEVLDVWPVECENLKADVEQVDDLAIFTVSKHPPICLRIIEDVDYVDLQWLPGQPLTLDDPEGKWEHITEACIVYIEGRQGTVATVSWANNVATFTPIAENLEFLQDSDVQFIGVTWHWMCGGKFYYGNQLSRVTKRFMTDASVDIYADTPSSLLTTGLKSSSDGNYPIELIHTRGTVKRGPHLYGSDAASHEGNWWVYKWSNGNPVIGDANYIRSSPASITWGAMHGADTTPRDVYWLRLIEVNAAAENMTVLVKRGDSILEYTMNTSYGVVQQSVVRNWQTYLLINTYSSANGNNTTTAYKYVAFNGEPAFGLQTDDLVYVLVRWPNLPANHLQEYNKYKNGTLIPAPGLDQYMGAESYCRSVSSLGNRLVFTGFVSYPTVAQVSEELVNGHVDFINLYTEDVGELSSTDPYIVVTNLHYGELLLCCREYNGSLFLFSHNSTYRVSSNTGNYPSATNFMVTPIFGVGAVSVHAVSRTRNLLVFLSKNGLYTISYNNSAYQLDNRGVPIEDVFLTDYNENTSWLTINPVDNSIFIGTHSHTNQSRYVTDTAYKYSIIRDSWQEVALYYGKANIIAACYIASPKFSCVVAIEASACGSNGLPSKPISILSFGTIDSAYFLDKIRIHNVGDAITLPDVPYFSFACTQEYVDLHEECYYPCPATTKILRMVDTTTQEEVAYTVLRDYWVKVPSKHIGNNIACYVPSGLAALHLQPSGARVWIDDITYNSSGTVTIDPDIVAIGGKILLGYTYPQYYMSARHHRETITFEKQSKSVSVLCRELTTRRRANGEYLVPFKMNLDLVDFNNSIMSSVVSTALKVGRGGFFTVGSGLVANSKLAQIVMWNQSSAGFSIDCYQLVAVENTRRTLWE